MKKLFILLAACSATALFTACGGGAQTKTAGADTPAQEAVSATRMDVDRLLENAESLKDRTVEVEGICTHICKHGGRKLFMMGSSDKKTIQVLASKEIGAFPEECINSMVRIKGTLKEDRIDEAYLAGLEQKLSQNTLEKHGDGKAGCASEMKARGEGQASTMQQRIDAMRGRIEKRKAEENKAYLSFYHIDGLEYEIVK